MLLCEFPPHYRLSGDMFLWRAGTEPMPSSVAAEDSCCCRSSSEHVAPVLPTLRMCVCSQLSPSNTMEATNQAKVWLKINFCRVRPASSWSEIVASGDRLHGATGGQCHRFTTALSLCGHNSSVITMS